MLRRTTPAVSFSVSHSALMYRASRPLLGGGMNSSQLVKAAWDEMPFTHIHTCRKDYWSWIWKAKYELGIRDHYRHTKIRIVTNYIMAGICLYGMTTYVYWAIYVAAVGKRPWYAERENATAYSKKRYGVDVWCADGKFLVPWTHINPPMLTITLAELNA